MKTNDIIARPKSRNIMISRTLLKKKLIKEIVENNPKNNTEIRTRFKEEL